MFGASKSNRSKIATVSKIDENIPSLEDMGLYIGEDDKLHYKIGNKQYEYKVKRASGNCTSTEANTYNDLFWFAMNARLMEIVHARLSAMNFTKEFIPDVQSSVEPHASIYLSSNFRTATNTMVVFSDDSQLGLWSGRLTSHSSIRFGSMEELCRVSIEEDRAIVLASPSQIIWHHDLSQAMTPHQFACAGGRNAHTSATIPGSTTKAEYMVCVLQLISRQHVLAKNYLDIVVQGYCAYLLLSYLDENWSLWEERLRSLVLIASSHTRDDIKTRALQDFLQTVSLTN